ncbi:MAG: SUMF1/EgtB/PvdO family nonheme iron enzyme [Labilithrix sp.]|nr:SUMF1/EgtB/PvdO family nonheme iron enzyme [Labilithrix sp.]
MGSNARRRGRPPTTKVAAGAIVLASVHATACGLVFDVDALERGSATSTSDAGPDAPAAAAEAGDGAPSCVSTRGPAMVLADGECIDSTEVTVEQYDTFLSSAGAPGADVLPLAKPCDWLKTLVPDDFTQQRTNGRRPVVYVNYCQAYAFCAWANKRLCGKVGGGALLPGDAGMDPQQNQWLRACTRSGTQDYSYGETVAVGACKHDIVAVGQRSACDGPYPGLSDMLGNAGEWIDACANDGPTRERDGCMVLGYEGVRDEASCWHRIEVSRYQTSPDLGFRCCGITGP